MCVDGKSMLVGAAAASAWVSAVPALLRRGRYERHDCDCTRDTAGGRTSKSVEANVSRDRVGS
jgi:hypothetical protein